MSETTNAQVIYVWTKTEKAGKIVEEDSRDNKFIYFTDGSRINVNLESEMLLKAADSQEAEQISAQISGTTADQAPTTQSTDQSTPSQSEKTTQPKQSQTAESSVDENKVVLHMLEKVSANNTEQIALDFNIPSSEVFNLLKDQMDEDAEQLKAYVLDLIEKQIDSQRDEIKQQVKSQLDNYYLSNESKPSLPNPDEVDDKPIGAAGLSNKIDEINNK